MFRTPRAIAHILRVVLLASATTSLPLASGVVLSGCADENQPETWVKKLDDPVQRPAAIKRLVQFFEDAMTRANKDRNDPQVKALLDKIVEPLTRTYVEATLDDRTRVELIKLLADTRDVRAKAAWIKALSSFGKGQGATEDDVRWAAPAVGATKLEEAAEAMAAAFVKLEAGTQKGSQAYKNLHDAMLALKSPSWKQLMIDRLNREISAPSGPGDNAKVEPYRNELFWQQTAAELLGELRDPAAVEPLFKAVMSKPDLGGTASMALIKIGKPATGPLQDIMLGKNAEIVNYAKTHPIAGQDPTKPYVRVAAVVLGGIGRGEAAGPMIRALEGADSDLNRAILARELTNLPTTPDTVRAFQGAYEKIAPTLIIPPSGDNARQTLLEAASRFYDPELVPWLLKQVKDAKGSEDEKAVVKQAGLATAAKLMRKKDIALVKAAVDKDGGKPEKEVLAAAAQTLNACDANMGCYLSKVQEPAVQQKEHQFSGIKAAYMLGIEGNAQTALDAAKQLSKVTNPAIKFATGLAIDHLVQKDTAPVIEALQKVVGEESSGGNEPIKQIMHRLRAR